MTIRVFLLVLAFVLFALAAVGAPSGRFNLIGGGLAAATLAFVLA